jgi:hypothetical protein
LGHVPNWFRLRLLRAFGTERRCTLGRSVLRHALQEAERQLCVCSADRWLDHWGSTIVDGEVCFVSDPYLEYPPDPTVLAVPDHIACATNCRLLVTPDSAWNPPVTFRLLFKPNEEHSE